MLNGEEICEELEEPYEILRIIHGKLNTPRSKLQINGRF